LTVPRIGHAEILRRLQLRARHGAGHPIGVCGHRAPVIEAHPDLRFVVPNAVIERGEAGTAGTIATVASLRAELVHVVGIGWVEQLVLDVEGTVGVGHTDASLLPLEAVFKPIAIVVRCDGQIVRDREAWIDRC